MDWSDADANFNTSKELWIFRNSSQEVNESETEYIDFGIIKNTIVLVDYSLEGSADTKEGRQNTTFSDIIFPLTTSSTSGGGGGGAGVSGGGSVGRPLSDLEASDIVLCVVLGSIILVTIIGNMLVISAIATTRRLRTVTNFFVMSLAVSDLLVGFLVMPLAVVHEITQAWLLGKIACELWISLDVMLCTASILNLCCISVDRYFAITSPMAYVVKRSKRLALFMIAAVWVASALITCPPMFGWHEGNRENTTECGYNSNQGYVVYSALGSFYIPAIVIVYVYCRIFSAARRRQEVLCEGDVNLTDKAEDVPVSTKSSSSSAGTAVVTSYRRPRIVLTSSPAEDGNDKMSGEAKSLNDIATSNNHGGVCRCTSRSRSRIPLRMVNSDPSYDSPTELKTANGRGGGDALREGGDGSDQLSKHRGGWRTRTWKGAERKGSVRYLMTPPGGMKTGSSATTMQKRNYERAAFQRERRLAKSLSVVVGGFFVCWLPFFITYLLEPFCTSCYFHPTLQSSLVWLGWINSGINPFIYAFNNVDFRKAFARLTIDKCRRGRRRPLRRHDPRNFL